MLIIFCDNDLILLQSLRLCFNNLLILCYCFLLLFKKSTFLLLSILDHELLTKVDLLVYVVLYFLDFVKLLGEVYVLMGYSLFLLLNFIEL